MGYNVKVLKSFRRIDNQFLHGLMYITLIEAMLDYDVFLAEDLMNDFYKKILKLN